MSTKIQWTQETWNPFVGCDKVSDGCRNCYAIRMAWRLAHMPHTKAFYGPAVTKTTGGDLNWTGNIVANIPAGDKPLRTKKPTMFFVNSMSDLFHEDITFEMIDSVYDVMDVCPQHTFQVLTKRGKHLLEYYQWKKSGNGLKFQQWPLKNVWVGVSVENQKAADERIPYLLQVPTIVRFLSCEPLLGPVDISIIHAVKVIDPGNGLMWLDCEKSASFIKYIDWVIVGGESGYGARPTHPNWFRLLRDQCIRSSVPFFFKQHGEYREMQPGDLVMGNGGVAIKTRLHYQIHTDDTAAIKGGNKNNGDLLDGIEYKEFPVIKR